jgi:hypothetical protein
VRWRHKHSNPACRCCVIVEAILDASPSVTPVSDVYLTVSVPYMPAWRCPEAWQKKV